ncbi:uncharacterized protein PFL1_05125 [Pseudozyma flocculosa PF-1]|uniref:BZIP domain-containing protein n=2 Tax=Pseudozyma flocculosa TaxID=84751 RepID=A0A5C3F743_9BASI|nr:uncharacterized protein PFL1_05125 [Pseudozyma flocculosa PF-1]EPQ27202.1 hypothetical protein PFL1_05125 [Pseudozyma flocculosa PF-1]SPO39565.1 uncharacterized protein PSFLO_05046 [Pseudozyma flocculosa]
MMDEETRFTTTSNDYDASDYTHSIDPSVDANGGNDAAAGATAKGEAEAAHSPQQQHGGIPGQEEGGVGDGGGDATHDDVQALEAVMQLAQAASAQHHEYQQQLEQYQHEHQHHGQHHDHQADGEHADGHGPTNGGDEGGLAHPFGGDGIDTASRKRSGSGGGQGGSARGPKAQKAQSPSGPNDAGSGMHFGQPWENLNQHDARWHQSPPPPAPAPPSSSAPVEPAVSAAAPGTIPGVAVPQSDSTRDIQTSPTLPLDPAHASLATAGGASGTSARSASADAGADGGADATQASPSKPARQLSTSKRAAQNRAAQRAFRERRDKYVKELEGKAAMCEQALRTADESKAKLREALITIDGLRQDNHSLRVALAALGGHVAGPPPPRLDLDAHDAEMSASKQLGGNDKDAEGQGQGEVDGEGEGEDRLNAVAAAAAAAAVRAEREGQSGVVEASMERSQQTPAAETRAVPAVSEPSSVAVDQQPQPQQQVDSGAVAA